MKRIYFFAFSICAMLSFANKTQAQTNYFINASSTFFTRVGANTCNNCNFYVGTNALPNAGANTANITFTIGNTTTCTNCSFYLVGNNSNLTVAANLTLNGNSAIHAAPIANNNSSSLNINSGVTVTSANRISSIASYDNNPFSTRTGTTFTLNAHGQTLNMDIESVNTTTYNITSDVTFAGTSFFDFHSNTNLNISNAVVNFSNLTTAGGNPSWAMTSSTDFTVTNSTVNFSNSVVSIDGNSNAVVTNSVINLKGTTSMTLTNGINLVGSQLIIGDAHSTASTANLNIASGIVLSVNPSSFVRLANINNYIAGGGGATPGRVRNSTPTTIFNASRTSAGNGGNPSGATPYKFLTTSPTFPTGQWIVVGPAATNAAVTSFVPDAPLPVVLVDFKAVYNNNKTVGITWATQQEVNSNYFAVQRSADGINWESIGTVSARINSTIVSDYSFTDQKPGDGANYYRLQAFDLDGKYGFTEIRVIRAAMLKTFSVFPNPANGIANVSIGNNFRGTLRLYNLFGQMMLQRVVSSEKDGSTISLPVHNFPAGHYLLQSVQEDGSKQTENIQIVH